MLIFLSVTVFGSWLLVK